MPRTIRFHLDENCHRAVAESLSRRGIDITTTPHAGLMSVTDAQQLSYGLAEGRVVFTKTAISYDSMQPASPTPASSIVPKTPRPSAKSFKGWS